MTHQIRKMLIVLAVALLAAALLSACGKKPQDGGGDARSGKAAEEEYTGPRKYSVNTYVVLEDGTKELTTHDSYELDEKGHEILHDNTYYESSESSVNGGRKIRRLYDDRGRMVYMENIAWKEHAEIR